MFRNFIHNLTILGVHSDTLEKEAKRIRITNILAFLCMTYLYIRSVPYFFLGGNYGFIMLGASTFLGIVPLLNYFQRYTMARYSLMIICNGYIFALSYAFLGGVKSGVQGLVLIGVMFPLMLFDISRKIHIILGLFISLCTLAALFFLEIYSPRDSVFTGSLFIFTMIGISTLGTLVAFFAGYFFYSMNEISERKLRKANEKYRIKVNELVTDRILLRNKNKLIQNDIQMATRIQKGLLPSKSPHASIAFYYQPMHDLGGDFISFSELPENKIAFMISDVSGHGVTAAFITLMVKNTLEQERLNLDKPDLILSKLNKILLHQANYHFVTALCGILDVKSRNLKIASAGHVSPYVLKNGAAEKLVLPTSGIPLGVLPVKNFPEEKKYVSYNYEFQEGDTLLFYTDGLSEAMPIGDYSKGDYEKCRLVTMLERISGLPPQQFVDELMQDVRNFRNSPHFEDDICTMVWKV